MITLRDFDYSEITRTEKAKLSTMEVALRAGLSRTAEALVERYQAALSSSSSSNVQEIWQDMLSHLQAMKQIEKIYGFGAMLDTSRSLVLHLLKAKKDNGEPAISQQMLEASKRRAAIVVDFRSPA